MANIRHLKKAPIKEAILELQWPLNESLELKRLESVFQKIENEFPKKHAIETRAFQLKFGSGVHTQASSSESIGIRADSKDGHYIVQVRKNGFAFSRLQPYEDWKSFFAKAMALWEVFKTECNPTKVSRLGVRYINELNANLPAYMEDVFVTETVLFPSSFAVRSFVSQAEIASGDGKLSARIIAATQVPSADKKETTMKVLVDIDAFKSSDLSLDSAALVRDFEALHHFKNEVFFGLLTDKVLEENEK